MKITGTNRSLEWNNGWGFWQMPFKEWRKGSALPKTAKKSTPTATPSADPTADPTGQPTGQTSPTGETTVTG